MALATVENAIGDGGERTLRRNGGSMTTLAFAALVTAFGVATGSVVAGVGLGAILIVGSALVAAGGEPLATRSAAMVGTIHLLAITLITL